MSLKTRRLSLSLTLTGALLAAAAAAQQPASTTAAQQPSSSAIDAPSAAVFAQPAAPAPFSREIDWNTVEAGPERALSMEPIDLLPKPRATLARLLKGMREVRRQERSTNPPPPFRAIQLPAGQPDLVVATNTPPGEDGLWFLADVSPHSRILAKITASILWVQPTSTNGLNDLLYLRFLRRLPTLIYLRYNGRAYQEAGTHLLLPCPATPGLFHPSLCLPSGRAFQVPQQSSPQGPILPQASIPR